MVFRSYTNIFSRASRPIATGIFILGLLLIGFGVLIIALPELFALLAAMVFFAAGAGCAITAVKIFIAQRRLNKFWRKQPQDYRKNVQIHSNHNHQ